MADVTLKNAEIASPDFQGALIALMNKPLPVSLAWQLADLKEYVEKRFKKYQEAKRALFIRFGARADGQNLVFDKDNPLPAECSTEMVTLDAIEGHIQLTKFQLPEKDAAGKEISYEPIIISGMRKFFTEHQSTIKEME